MMSGVDGGKDDKLFVGMIPLNDDISAMDSKLNTNSTMLTDLGLILDHTEKIDSAVTLTTQTRILTNMLALSVCRLSD